MPTLSPTAQSVAAIPSRSRDPGRFTAKLRNCAASRSGPRAAPRMYSPCRAMTNTPFGERQTWPLNNDDRAREDDPDRRCATHADAYKEVLGSADAGI